MTKLLDQAIKAVQGLSSDQQDQIAHMMLLYAVQPLIQLTPGEEADLIAAGDEIARGDFATEEKMRAIWAKHER